MFKTLDLFTGYWQIRTAEECKEITTFVCKFVTFKFEVMPFGLMNAPSTFQRMMDHLFRGVSHVCVYFDGVIVFSKYMEDHMVHLMDVFRRLSQFRLKLKIKKCAFAQPRVKILGHIVDKDGIAVDEEKKSVVKLAPVPRTKTKLRSFLGMASYCIRFVKGFSNIAAPLHVVTSANVEFKWTDEMQVPFELLTRSSTEGGFGNKSGTGAPEFQRVVHC